MHRSSIAQISSSRKRVIFDGGRIHDITGGRVGLVHQGRADDIDLGGYLTDLQVTVDGGGAIAIDQDLAVGLGFEPLFRERQLIDARGQIRNRIRTAALRVRGDCQVGRSIAGGDGDVGDARTGRVGYSSRDPAKNLLRVRRSAGHEGERRGYSK